MRILQGIYRKVILVIKWNEIYKVYKNVVYNNKMINRMFQELQTAQR